jgi:hypothetical protein
MKRLRVTGTARLPLWKRALLWPALFVISAIAGIIATIIAIPVTILTETVLRGRCPDCHRRGLRGVRVAGDSKASDGETRDFQWSECDYCHHEFRHFDDRTFRRTSPPDPQIRSF